MFNTLTLTSSNALGDIRYINYLDEDVLGATGDILWPTGTPGEADFRLFTLNDPDGYTVSFLTEPKAKPRAGPPPVRRSSPCR